MYRKKLSNKECRKIRRKQEGDKKEEEWESDRDGSNKGDAESEEWVSKYE